MPVARRAVGRRGRHARPSWLDRELERVNRILSGLGKASEELRTGLTLLFKLSVLVVWATAPLVDHGHLPFSVAIAVPLLGAVAFPFPFPLLVWRRCNPVRSMVA